MIDRARMARNVPNYVSKFDSSLANVNKMWRALQKKTWPKTQIKLGIVKMKSTVSLCMLLNRRLLKNKLYIACTNGDFKSDTVMWIPYIVK